MPRHWSAGHIRSRLASSLHEVPRRYPWNFALFLFILSSHYGCLQPRTQSELPTEVPAATEETISPPNALAAFDADGTLWADDLGEAFFLEHLMEQQLQRYARMSFDKRFLTTIFPVMHISLPSSRDPA